MRPLLVRIFLTGALFTGSCGLVRAYSLEGCDSAADTMNLVREKLAASPTTEDLGVIEYLLGQATTNCVTLGDAWHYRAAIQRKLGKKPADIAQSERMATRYHSEARAAGVNPFEQKSGDSGDDKIPPYVREKWAVVVGAGEFKDPNVPALQFSAKDAEDFASVLTDPASGRFKQSNVRVLTQKNATLQNIREAIGWLRENVQKEDLVVVYFSSHGSPREMDPNGVSYVITYDTDLSSAATRYATSLQMIDLVQSLNREIKARRVAMFLDTCYSGDAAGSKRITPVNQPATFSGALEGLRSAVGRAVISASKADERSWEAGKLNHGYFTFYLLEALKQNKGQNKLDDVFEYVKSKTHESVWRDQHQEQTPVILKTGQAGDIVLGVDPKGS